MSTLFERIIPIEARLLHEGVFDPNILKAIFFSGSPAAGKTTINHQMFGGVTQAAAQFGLKILDIDANYTSMASMCNWVMCCR